ncbi:hypothetical protein AB0L41_05650 [Amycolatopsis mediterranei]|uniref:hypothetical protein n=1 Tax=Amycolatopsis mediterranei TaxID=33910 RepID=UPI003444105E
MAEFRSVRRCAAAASLVLATCFGLVAPEALASTMASCSTAIQGLDETSLVLPRTCAGFPDQGAPYVFRIGTLYGWRRILLDILLVSLGPATATCSDYEVSADGLRTATHCTFTS